MIERKLFSFLSYLRAHSRYVKILLVFLSIGVPLILLYCLYPLSFDKTFNGRAYYLFFVWLVLLEFAIDWDKYGSKTSNMPSKNTIVFGVALTLPTVYVIVSNFFGLNAAITEITRASGIISSSLGDYVARLNFIPLATEFLTFAVLFAVIILYGYRLKSLADFALPIAMLLIVGLMSMINLLSPLFQPFQIIVPTTAKLSEGVLRLMGYATLLYQGKDFTTTMIAGKGGGNFGAQIVWPCAGIDSLIIYTVVILLFLRKAYIPKWQKIVYFIVGAVVTYFINVLRIATIFVIGVNKGDVWGFHDYWGQLYSMTWIVAYMLLIIGSRILWSKLRSGNSKETVVKDGVSLDGQINPTPGINRG